MMLSMGLALFKDPHGPLTLVKLLKATGAVTLAMIIIHLPGFALGINKMEGPIRKAEPVVRSLEPPRGAMRLFCLMTLAVLIVSAMIRKAK